MSRPNKPPTDEDLIERLEISRENAKTTLQRQFEQIDSLDKKAIELIKINTIVAGIFLAGISFAVRTATGEPAQQTNIATELNLFLLIGLSLLVASAAFAATSYGPQGIIIGPSEKFLRDRVTDVDNLEEDRKAGTGGDSYETNLKFQKDLTKTYAHYLEQNNSTQDTKALLTSISVLLIICGSISLIIGILLLLNVKFFEIILVLAAIIVVITLMSLGSPIIKLAIRIIL